MVEFFAVFFLNNIISVKHCIINFQKVLDGIISSHYLYQILIMWIYFMNETIPFLSFLFEFIHPPDIKASFIILTTSRLDFLSVKMHLLIMLAFSVGFMTACTRKDTTLPCEDFKDLSSRTWRETSKSLTSTDWALEWSWGNSHLWVNLRYALPC